MSHPEPRRPVVLRGGTVLTMDDAHTVLADADVLVVADRVAGVGTRLDAPADALEIDARGGIVLPGMIDTHHHLRADVHTVLVDGRLVKHEHRLVGADLAAVRRTVEATVDHLRSALGEDAWARGMNPDLPNTEVLDNPYQYTAYKSDSTHGARPEPT